MGSALITQPLQNALLGLGAATGDLCHRSDDAFYTVDHKFRRHSSEEETKISEAGSQKSDSHLNHTSICYSGYCVHEIAK
jgi:hypothetical protein